MKATRIDIGIRQVRESFFCDCVLFERKLGSFGLLLVITSILQDILNKHLLCCSVQKLSSGSRFALNTAQA